MQGRTVKSEENEEEETFSENNSEPASTPVDLPPSRTHPQRVREVTIVTASLLGPLLQVCGNGISKKNEIRSVSSTPLN